MLVKGNYLHQTHGVPNLDAQFPGPYSYKEYCWLVLNCQFWGGGGVVILNVVSCVWALKITVINSKVLQQYRVWHHAPLKGVNTAIVFIVSCHFIAAGESQHLFQVIWSLSLLLNRRYGCLCGLNFSLVNFWDLLVTCGHL